MRKKACAYKQALTVYTQIKTFFNIRKNIYITNNLKTKNKMKYLSFLKF